jgi:hypothetical protein
VVALAIVPAMFFSSHKPVASLETTYSAKDLASHLVSCINFVAFLYTIWSIQQRHRTFYMPREISITLVWLN